LFTKVRTATISVAGFAVVWAAVAVTGCSHPEPVAVAAQSRANGNDGVLRSKTAFSRGDRRSARRGRTQELQLLPSPSGSLLDNDLDEADRPQMNNGLCPPEMASIDDRYCIDRFEASLVEILPNGDERSWSPYDAIDHNTVGARLPNVRAVSVQGSIPQAYISEVQAKAACSRSGKRLCKAPEWKRACMGPSKTVFPYGATREPGKCNDHGRAPMGVVFGFGVATSPRAYSSHMNDPQLNRLSGTVAATGSHAGCTNDYGVYDMVGNVHEWVDDPDGTFLGGYYLDTHQLGDGCNYRTPGHDIYYHDYSTGFRCCADVAQ
jgi:hypothetical protein